MGENPSCKGGLFPAGERPRIDRGIPGPGHEGSRPPTSPQCHASKTRLVFLDRDGTINTEVHYLSRLEDLGLIEGAAEGIRLLNQCGRRVVVVSNQSGVARGYFEEDFLLQVQEEIARRLADHGAFIDAWYHCPHHPDAGRAPYRTVCACRKPLPGLVHQACRDLALTLEGAVVVGDGRGDLELAVNIGATFVLVRTGHGERTLADLPPGLQKKLAYVAVDLLDACKWICASA